MNLKINTYKKTISFTTRIKENFKADKWHILIPGPVGCAALASTIAFMISNPFGWTFSATLIGLGIAFATMNAITALGYSLYMLLKEPRQLKNSFTYYPELSAESLIEAIQAQFGPKAPSKVEPSSVSTDQPPGKETPLSSQKKSEQELVSPSPPPSKEIAPKQHKRRRRGVHTLRKGPRKITPLPAYVPLAVRHPMQKKQKGWRETFPVHQALVLGGLLLGGYALYTYFAGSSVTGSLASRILAIGAPPLLQCPRIEDGKRWLLRKQCPSLENIIHWRFRQQSPKAS